MDCCWNALVTPARYTRVAPVILVANHFAHHHVLILTTLSSPLSSSLHLIGGELKPREPKSIWFPSKIKPTCLHPTRQLGKDLSAFRARGEGVLWSYLLCLFAGP